MIQKLKKIANTYNNPVQGITIQNKVCKGRKTVFIISIKVGKKVCYYRITYFGYPQPKIDKWTFTLPIAKIEDQERIKERCDGEELNFYTKSLYKYNYRVQINGSVVHVSFSPYNQGDNYLRISYNPYALKGHKIMLKKLLVELIPEGFKCENMHMTRSDVAIDYPAIKPVHLLVKSKRYKVAHTYCNGKGEIETNYLGSPKSKAHYCVYDKTLQLKNKYGKTIKQITRIEARVKNSNWKELKECDPFKNMEIFHAPAIEVKDYEWKFFLEYARTYGIQTALRQIPKQNKKKYQDQLKHLTAEWWQPKLLLVAYQKQLNQMQGFYNELSV